ncbi:MAG: hypothetical protein IPG74_03340 [Flavobacteriales bacterium]|nr:hypothetical protein [Flavobacteriales bacterium]
MEKWVRLALEYVKGLPKSVRVPMHRGPRKSAFIRTEDEGRCKAQVMVTEQLASALGRTDEQPNIALAEAIVAEKNVAGVRELSGPVEREEQSA